MPISSHFIRALRLGIGVGVLAGLAGCARLAEEPEVNPDRWAPPSADRIWTPSPASASDYRMPSELRPPPGAATPAPAQPSGQEPAHQQGQPYDLPALLDLALRVNPDTRFAWESARQAAASFGAARAPYYPLVSANSANGYTRTLFPLPGGQLAQFKFWQARAAGADDLHAAGFRPPQFQRRGRAPGAGRRQFQLRPQDAGRGLRSAARVLRALRGQGRSDGGAPEPRACAIRLRRRAAAPQSWPRHRARAAARPGARRAIAIRRRQRRVDGARRAGRSGRRDRHFRRRTDGSGEPRDRGGADRARRPGRRTDRGYDKAAARPGGEGRGAARERGAGRAGQGGLVSDRRSDGELRPAHLAIHLRLDRRTRGPISRNIRRW